MNPVAVLCWSTGMRKALPDERKGPLTWVETRGIEPRTSCLQIADHHSCGVSTVLEPRSQSGLTHPYWAVLLAWSWHGYWTFGFSGPWMWSR